MGDSDGNTRTRVNAEDGGEANGSGVGGTPTSRASLTSPSAMDRENNDGNSREGGNSFRQRDIKEENCIGGQSARAAARKAAHKAACKAAHKGRCLGDVVCIMCGVEADVYCGTCEENLCECCSGKVHKMKKYRDHVVRPSLNRTLGDLPDCDVSGCGLVAEYHCAKCERPLAAEDRAAGSVGHSKWEGGFFLCENHEVGAHRLMHADHHTAQLPDVDELSDDETLEEYPADRADEGEDSAEDIHRQRRMPMVLKSHEQKRGLSPGGGSGRISRRQSSKDRLKKQAEEMTLRKQNSMLRQKREKRDRHAVLKEARGFWKECCGSGKDLDKEGKSTYGGCR